MLLIKTAEQVSRDEIAKAMTEGKPGNEAPKRKKKKRALLKGKKNSFDGTSKGDRRRGMEESKELPVVEQGQQLWGYDR